MTRTPAPVTPPIALTVATSDSGGGAGIQADLKTMEACGAFGTSVLVATTAQNTRGVERIHTLPVEQTHAQLDAVTDDFDVGAAKTGMLATADIVRAVAERARQFDFPLVVDPVMVAASGDRLLEPAGEAAYEALIERAALVTPNADEAAVLTGTEVTGEDSARRAGEALVGMGADAALVKGGHVSGEDVLDVLVTGDAVETVRHPRVETESTHGSGCTLSAAIAAHLAEGADLAAAVRSGIDLLSRAVRYPLDVGEGPGAVHHTVSLRDRAERQPTAERVSEIVCQLADREVSRLVPDAGMDVVGATPYAEHPAECAAVEGGLVRLEDGVESPRGVRFGSSPTVARRLLAAREVDADLRFAAECRYDDGVAAALDSLDGRAATSASVEGDAADGSPDAVRDRVGRAFDDGDSPVAVIDRAVEPATVTVFAPGSAALSDRLVTLLEAIPDGA